MVFIAKPKPSSWLLKIMEVPPIIPNAISAQKLVTVYLDNTAYAKGRALVGNFADQHGLVEEHLTSYLSQGWKVVSVHGFGGNSDSLSVRGWLAVLLEKSAG
jgi:hypothetical protein